MEPVTFDRKILSVAMTQEIDRKNFQTSVHNTVELLFTIFSPP